MPLLKYHRKPNNYYFSRYGETWVEKLNNYSFMSKLCCIIDLVRFMVKEGEKIMKRSLHEDNCYIVHGVLVNQLYQWLMPFKRLQYKTTYDRRLVGNIPEFMPLDNSHNRDILHSLLFHCVFRRFVLKGEVNNEDKKRYLVMPPKRNFQWNQENLGIRNGIAFFNKNY